MGIISFGWGSRFGSRLREGEPSPTREPTVDSYYELTVASPTPVGAAGNQPFENWWFTVVVRIGIPDSWECSPEELECDFDQCFHGYWDTVTPSRLKFPGADGRGRAFVQTLTKRI